MVQTLHVNYRVRHEKDGKPGIIDGSKPTDRFKYA